MIKRFIALVLSVIMVLVGIVSVNAENGDPNLWTLTQYYGGGSVGMFYSIINQSDGILILIDGGYTANADQVRSVIEENGDVDYWILTHYHEDHCGAFNALWPEYKDKIGTVYVTPLSWEEFEPYCNDWDTPNTFKLFLEQTANAENIIALHRGDKFEINDLRFTVFNAWDDEILPVTKDVANNCSLVFKIQGVSTSFLFFGDVGRMAPYLLKKYGAKALQADYVQAGHHGWGVETEVYEAIIPTEMFIDAEDGLIRSEEYADKHGILVKWCEDQGIPMHTYGGVPYRINIK